MLKSPLASLQGWSREHLLDLTFEFRQLPSMSVTLDKFCQLLHLNAGTQAEDAFHLCVPKNDCVNFLSVLAPMVVTSNQQYISKASFLFSIFDLNSDGMVNRAEFFIAMRMLVVGTANFYMGAQALDPQSLEKLTNEVFDRIDDDCSGSIDLGEALAFAYRSKALLRLFLPFPPVDTRIFEYLVVFNGQSTFMQTAVDRATDHETKTVLKKTQHGAGCWYEV